MSLQVKYVDIPLGAQEAASAYTSAYQRFGAEQQLLTGAEDTPWATLEPGSWKLDGTGMLFSEWPSDVGWWSAFRSEADGRFLQPPVIQILFPQGYTATGITFDFWESLNHWCSEISVTWYKENVVLQEVTAFPDEPHWVLDNLVEGFDRIDISLLATNHPGHFAKIRKITIGQIAVFAEDELVQVRLLQEVDPSLCELSVDTLSVAVRDRKNRILFPQKNQSVQLYQNGELIASHYVSDFSRQGQQDYRFRCKSSVGKLEDVYLGGILYTTVGEFLQTLLQDVPYELDEEFENIRLDGFVPFCTRREALQQVAFAIGAVVTTGADGTIYLRPEALELGGSFADDQVFLGAKVTQKTRIAQVQLMAHRYIAGDVRETLLNEEVVSGSDGLYVFSKPYYSYLLTGGELEDQGGNWVKIRANGPVTLTARPFVHTTVSYSMKNPQATAQEQGNVVTIKNATLVNPDNAQQVLNRLYWHYMQRNLLQQQVVVSGQQVGQLIRSVNPWDTATEGYLISMDRDFTGTGQTAQISILGQEVPRQ